MIESRNKKVSVRLVITYSIIIALGFLCFFPLCNVLAMSFSSSAAVQQNRVGLFPVDFNLLAYEKIISDAQFWRSFGISTLKVILGLIINVTLAILTAYPLSKTNIEFKGRNVYMYLLLFAMLFSGGMIPIYMVVKNLNLLNTIWALVLPNALPIGNVIMVMNFMIGLPKSLEEAALVDGASPLQVLLHVVVPCSKPVIATISLFSIVGNWNDYFGGLIYITKIKNYPLMSYIQSITVNMRDLIESGASLEQLQDAAKISGQNLNAAKIVVATIPLMLVYPFLQKYLITGIVMGSVKE